MSTIINKIRGFFEARTEYERFIDSANTVKESEDRMRHLGTLNMNLLYMSKC